MTVNEMQETQADRIAALLAQGFTARELMGMELQQRPHVIPGILTEGLTILGGKPKEGKSWMALGFAIAVATGGKALGQIDVEQGRVLYLALEDTKGGLHSRMDMLLSDEEEWPGALDIFTAWPRLDMDGEAALDTYLSAHPDTRLVIVDTLAIVRPPSKGSQPTYQEDYAAMAPLKELADRHGIALLVLTHMRKMIAEDPLDNISGSTGLTGASDNVLALQRGQDGLYTLSGRGRTLEELEVSVRLEAGIWTQEQRAEDAAYSAGIRAIVGALTAAGEPLSLKELARRVNMLPNKAGEYCRRAVDYGLIDKVGRGVYSQRNTFNSAVSSVGGSTPNPPRLTGRDAAGAAPSPGGVKPPDPLKNSVETVESVLSRLDEGEEERSLRSLHTTGRDRGGTSVESGVENPAQADSGPAPQNHTSHTFRAGDAVCPDCKRWHYRSRESPLCPYCIGRMDEEDYQRLYNKPNGMQRYQFLKAIEALGLTPRQAMDRLGVRTLEGVDLFAAFDSLARPAA